MRICFVNSQFEKLGVEYVSAMLKRAGHEVALVHDPRLFQDSFKMTPVLARAFSLEKQVIDEAVGTRADLYAFAALGPDWIWTRRMSTALKARTGKPIVLGGLHASAATASVVRHPALDYVVTGEGEDAMVDLVAAIEDGRDAAAIPNVSLMRDGQAILNPNRPLIEDLDRLPFPDKSVYYDVSGHFSHGYNAIAARGCPKSCSYCFNSWYKLQFPNRDQYWRTRSVQNFLEEMEQAKARYRPSHFRFVDDDFVLDKAWFLEFAREYGRRVRVPYRVFLDADSCDPEVVTALDESGCFEAEMGVQTIRHDIRSKVFKRAQVAGQIQAAIDAFAKTRVTLVADNILGYPEQTPEDLGELISFYMDHRPSRVQNLWLRYWPGAPIIGIAQEAGYFTAEQARLLNEEPSERSCVLGDLDKPGWQKRASSFLYATFFLPRWFTAMWLKNQRFVRFPFLPEFTFYVLTNFTNTKISMYGRRFLHRYVKFGLYRVLAPFRRLVDRLFYRGRSPLAGPWSRK